MNVIIEMNEIINRSEELLEARPFNADVLFYCSGAISNARYVIKAVRSDDNDDCIPIDNFKRQEGNARRYMETIKHRLELY